MSVTGDRPILGLGYGPANLALSIELEKSGHLHAAQFLESEAQFGWQRHQLFPKAEIQNHPLRDLGLTIEDDHVSFLRYLDTKGRLLKHLHLNSPFPSRSEYADYLRWAAAQIPAEVRYSSHVKRLAITHDPHTGRHRFTATITGSSPVHAHHLVMGSGRSPRIPAVFAHAVGATVFHASLYNQQLRDVDLTGRSVAVVGASQSAIEIALDLLQHRHAAKVHLVHRGIGFRLKDTSSYSRRVFLPEFVNYFHRLPRDERTALRHELRSINYGACDGGVISELAALEYGDEVTGQRRVHRYPFSDVARCVPCPSHTKMNLQIVDRYTRASSATSVDFVVLATGYRDFGGGPDHEPIHPLLAEVIEHFVTEPDGVPVVNRDYSLRPRPGSIADVDRLSVYLNGLCEESHGMGDAGALAMVAHRARDIGHSLNSRMYDRPDVMTTTGA